MLSVVSRPERINNGIYPESNFRKNKQRTLRKVETEANPLILVPPPPVKLEIFFAQHSQQQRCTKRLSLQNCINILAGSQNHQRRALWAKKSYLHLCIQMESLQTTDVHQIKQMFFLSFDEIEFGLINFQEQQHQQRSVQSIRTQEKVVGHNGGHLHFLKWPRQRSRRRK